MRRVLLGLLTVVMAWPVIAIAAPIHATSTFIVGTGEELITFDGKPTKEGLIFQVQEPNRCLKDHWIILVYNDSDEAFTDMRVRLEVKIEGKWYLPSLDAETGIVPNTIKPDEWGWADAGTLGCADSDWDKVRVKRVKATHKNVGNIVDLRLYNATVNDGEITAAIANPTTTDVTDIQVEGLCMDEDGWFTDAFTTFINLRRLEAGDTITEQFGMNTGECDEPHLFLTAIALRRE